MKGRRPWAVLGLVVGVAVGWAVRPAQRRSCYGRYDLVPVVVAAVDVKAGEVVTFDLISQRSVPEQYVTSSIVKPDSAGFVVGQRLLVDVQAGDPLRWVDFGRDRLTPASGLRAFTITVPPERALSGQLTHGDHVDVLGVVDDPEAGRLARTLLSDAEVLGVEGERITLGVVSEESEVLMLAQEQTTLALALRSRQDKSVTESRGASLFELRTGRWRPTPGCRLGHAVQVIRNVNSP